MNVINSNSLGKNVPETCTGWFIPMEPPTTRSSCKRFSAISRTGRVGKLKHDDEILTAADETHEIDAARTRVRETQQGQMICFFGHETSSAQHGRHPKWHTNPIIPFWKDVPSEVRVCSWCY